MRSQDRVGSPPTASRPTIDQVRPKIREYYALPGNEVGGSLHILLDDGNLDTADVQFCLDRAHENNDWRGVWLALMFLKMSRRQRAKLVR